MIDSNEKQIKELYAAWAVSYDDSFNSVAVLVEDGVLIQYANPQANENILDIGCGTGRVTEQLYKYTKDVQGIDISPDMLRLAKLKLPSIAFQEADIQELIPFGYNTFDKVVSSLVFQFVQNTEKAFKEIHRVLKQGGKAYITAIVSDGTLDWADIEYKVKKEKTIPSGSVQKVSIFYEVNDYLNAANNAGFSSMYFEPLVVNSKTREAVTEESWNKIENKWASILLVLEK